MVTSAGAPPATLGPSLPQSLAVWPQPLPHASPEISSVKHRSEGPALLAPLSTEMLWFSGVLRFVTVAFFTQTTGQRTQIVLGDVIGLGSLPVQADPWTYPAAGGRMPEGGIGGSGRASF